MVRISHRLTRRSFVQLGGAVAAAWTLTPSLPAAVAARDPLLKEAIDRLEYLTPIERAFILDKGSTGITKLPPEKIREIGQVPETWSLEVIPDPASNSIVEQAFSQALGNALNWDSLMKLADRYSVRFISVTTCTNSENPFHISLWEGVPLREVLWLARPKDNVRRVYYQSYSPEGKAPFQSSLALGQIMENAPGDMPVILAYKMNGQVIPASHGGPVRMIVPGSYGSKSIKWVRRIVLTNEFKANDSDADLNNDPENALKTRARFINPPAEASAGKPVVLTGMAQVGIAGLRKVQYCLRSREVPAPVDDPYWTKADWKDAEILPPPQNWGGGLPGGKLPATNQTDPATGNPVEWPLRYLIVHWAALITAPPSGSYDLCCRTIDGNGIAQPMPRPFPRTGFNTLHIVPFIVKG
ncbi:MAG: molybdopterin-dependent oxidoreductase [Acidobacteriota bacterium]|jgi:DMSO/TMAO reductase YedYZ molybdopterin-dependent catalytic subunit|nr:molybdopterin-dependent oxidoreductase [Acidobacteriota bacterium]